VTPRTAPAVRSGKLSKVAINCPDKCSLHPSKIGAKNAAILKAMRENGAGGPTMGRKIAELLGHPMPQSNIARHLHHYVEIVDPKMPDESVDIQGGKPTDVEMLDAIILSGYRNSKNWKPTIRDTLEAMKLKVQMTGNSAFDDLISLFDSATDPDEPEEGSDEAPEAVLSPEERADDHDEDLGEPLAGE
jgi:hypothetical protein